MRLAFAMVCLSVAALADAGDAQAVVRKSMVIQAQALASALQLLAKERDVQILYRSEVVRNRHTPGAAGDLTVEEALTQILSGTGLTFRYLQSDAVTIVPIHGPTSKANAESGTKNSWNQEVPSEGLSRMVMAVRNADAWTEMRASQVEEPRRSMSGAPAIDAASAHDQAAKRAEIEEIVVTARKQSELLQDVPLTVTAFSSAQIENIGPKSLFDITLLSPGLNYQEHTNGRGGSRVYMRGVSGGTTGASRASVFLDGIFLPGNIQNIPFQAYERIEVLPGPQSAQFGRSTFGGAINYVTRVPGDQLSGVADLWYGSLGEQELFAQIAGPLSDNLRGSIYYWNQEFEGDFTDLNGLKNGSTRTNAVGGKLVLSATEALSITASSYYSEDSDGVPPAVWADPVLRPNEVPIARADGTTINYVAGELPAVRWEPKNGSKAINPNATQTRDERESWRSSLLIDYAIGDASLVLNAGYFIEKTVPGQRGTPIMMATQMDFIGNPNYALSQVRSELELNSAELRFSSSQGGRLRYSVGLFYQEFFTPTEGISYANNSCRTTCTWDVLGTFTVNTTVTPTSTSNVARNRSVFGLASYDLTDKTTLAVEARYQSEYIANRNNVSNFFIDGTWNSFLPRINLQYRVDDNIQVYGLYSVGTNPGVFNTSQFLGAPGTGTSLSQRQAEEEKLRNYEIGIKSEWLGRTLLVNAAVFYQVWDDMQVPETFFAPGGGVSVSVVGNRGQATIKGVEIESQWNPIAGLNLRGTFAWNPAKYSNYCSGNYGQLLARSDEPAPNRCVYVNGKRVEAASGQTHSLSADYSRNLTGDWSGFGRVSYQYQSKLYTEEWNSSWSGDATVFTGSVGVDNGPLKIELYCRNCGQESTQTRIARSFDLRRGPVQPFNFATASNLRRPRQVGLRVNYAF
jgi:iron complex outermembrane recepter protein